MHGGWEEFRLKQRATVHGLLTRNTNILAQGMTCEQVQGMTAGREMLRMSSQSGGTGGGLMTRDEAVGDRNGNSYCCCCHGGVVDVMCASGVGRGAARLS